MPETLASQTFDATAAKLYFTAMIKMYAAVKTTKAASPEIASAFDALDAHGGLTMLRNTILSGGDVSALIETLSEDEDFIAALDVATRAIYESLP